MKILKMIEEGKITAEEGARLLAALAGDRPSGRRREPSMGVSGGSARWLRVRVTDIATGRQKVSVNIPLGLVNVGLKIGARFAPDLEGVNLEEIVEAIRSGISGKIIDVIDEEDKEHVEIFIE
ncbi:MAG TPA: hypothetical protein G4O02_09480 [Caldilineae bacterium]|jgi:hypothetical protein|nr:hypothetical protein [Caldilineae bacterium]